MTTQIFGDMLYYPQTDLLTEFPTPESLKDRVLISTKPPKEYLESKQFKVVDSDSERDMAEEGSSSPVLIPEVVPEVEADDRVSRETFFFFFSNLYLYIFQLCMLMSSFFFPLNG